jgi:hypothetical protein
VPDAPVEPTTEVEAGPAAEVEVAGGGIIRVALATAALFTVASVLATAFPDRLRVPVAILDCVLFVAGIVVFLLAFGRAVNRSREELVDILGVFFLRADVAPRPVRVRLLGAFGLEVVVALVSASIRLYTAVAFGILVPLLGLALAGLWGARHGRFPERPDR